MKLPRQSFEILMLATALWPTAVQAQIDQNARSQQLLGDSAYERARAVAVAQTLGAANIGPELRAALVAALEREGRVHVEREQAGRRGQVLPELEAPEFLAMVAGAVAELHDPGTIPAVAEQRHATNARNQDIISWARVRG